LKTESFCKKAKRLLRSNFPPTSIDVFSTAYSIDFNRRLLTASVARDRSKSKDSQPHLGVRAWPFPFDSLPSRRGYGVSLTPVRVRWFVARARGPVTRRSAPEVGASDAPG
jgi:hypothetical protein